MHFFYDTCSLLSKGKEVFDTDKTFYISSITLKELENIKTSSAKDAETKYKARKLVKLLDEHEDQYQIIFYDKAWDQIIDNDPFLPNNDDSRIIISALHGPADSIIFVTQDSLCKRFAKMKGLNVTYLSETDADDYKGYEIIKIESDDEMAKLYDTIFNLREVPIPLKCNEYLIIKDKDDSIIDKYVYRNGVLQQLKSFPCFQSKMFGKVKPKDSYQWLAMESLNHNKITMLRGAAGTGKSYLAVSYLIQQLENGEIDRIIIFCNTVATNGAARLGYYPGSKDEKLLDSQIGNFLVSKLGGDKEYVINNYIDTGKIVLLPFSDIRGYDTTGMHAGIYITEAQNLDIELLRLALQRIGEDSICILDGDSDAQVDLGIYAGNNNGMRRASKVYRGEDLYGEVTLPIIHRSRIAQIAQRM